MFDKLGLGDNQLNASMSSCCVRSYCPVQRNVFVSAVSPTQRIRTMAHSCRVWMVWLETMTTTHTGSWRSRLQIARSKYLMLVSPLIKLISCHFIVNQVTTHCMDLVCRYWMLHSQWIGDDHSEIYNVVRTPQLMHISVGPEPALELAVWHKFINGRQHTTCFVLWY